MVEYNPQILGFISDAKEKQTVFSQLEELSGNRSLHVKDLKELVSFVSDILSYDEFHPTSGLTNTATSLAEAIIKASKDHTTSSLIHFSAIWVYYFNYDSEETLSMPLFKLYKNNGEDDALFINCSCTIYNNWNSFLDNPNICKSFMCVPDGGKYTFGYKNDSRMLCLQYMRSWVPEIQALLIVPSEARIVKKVITFIKGMFEEISIFLSKHHFILANVIITVISIATEICFPSSAGINVGRLLIKIFGLVGILIPNEAVKKIVRTLCDFVENEDSNLESCIRSLDPLKIFTVSKG